MINEVVQSSGLQKNCLVLLVHCSLGLGLGGFQARLLLQDGPEVVGGRVDLGRRAPGIRGRGGLKSINY